MNYSKITKIFIVTVIVGMGIFDIFVWIKGGTEATISWNVFAWSHDYPVFTFFIGFVMGHFFWQMKGKKKLQESRAVQNDAS